MGRPVREEAGSALKPDAVISYPAYGSMVTREWAASVRDLVVNRPRFGNKVITWQGALLFYNRNEIAKLFLGTDRDWMLMTDTDIVFSLEDVDALFEAADRNGPGIYSGVVMGLGTSGVKPIFGDWDPDRQTCHWWKAAPPRDEKEIPIHVVPTAFLLVHRDVLEAIGTGWFNHVVNGQGRVLGEDVGFSLRTLEKDYPVYLVPQSRPGHVKTGVFYADNTTLGEEE